MKPGRVPDVTLRVSYVSASFRVRVYTYFKLADEVVFLQQFVADELECVAFRRRVDGEHVKRPVVNRLSHDNSSTSRRHRPGVHYRPIGVQKAEN